MCLQGSINYCKRIKVIFDSQLSETWITTIVNCSEERKDHFELDNFNEQQRFLC